MSSNVNNGGEMTRMLPIRMIALLAACMAIHAVAGDMYKWQDESGNWHFSDIPPEDGESFDTFQVQGEPRQMVSMRKTGNEREPAHVFFNQYWGPAEIQLSLAEAENIHSEPALPARFVIPGQTERELVRFRPLENKKDSATDWPTRWCPAPPTTTLPSDLDFFPPFALGEEFTISQGIDDANTHTDAGSRFAVDVVMPEGTPVLAARGGVVMDVEDDFHGGGKQEARYLPRANQVRILHDDGSMATYAHLQPNSARVRPGMRVDPGRWIASSGNTGFSSGPHLHFVVQLNIGMALESLPFHFKLPTGGVMDPDRPQMLKGVLPLH